MDDDDGNDKQIVAVTYNVILMKCLACLRALCRRYAFLRFSRIKS